MGRRKNNPELVEELIEGRWTMDQDEFEEKYFSLSSSDMGKVLPFRNCVYVKNRL